MKRFTIITVVLIGALLIVAGASGQNSDQLKTLQTLLDSARNVEAPVFAPKAYQEAENKLKEAQRAIELQKKQQSIDILVGQSREFAENALKATQVAKLSLSEYLEPRNKSIKAKAPSLVPQLYQEAETQFMKATEKVESGDVKGGLKEADKSTPLFDTAELQAIKTDIMGVAAKLIEKAVVDEASKYALATLDRARTAYTKCDEILTKDRYNRKESREYVGMAEFEARHASNIAQSVRSLERNDQAWEKLMLLYEIEMQKVGSALGIAILPFDNGPGAAADTMIASVKALESAGGELSQNKNELALRLKKTLGQLNAPSSEPEPLRLAEILDSAVAALSSESERLASDLDARNEKLAQLELTHEQVSTELGARQAEDEKVKKVRDILNPTEGTILFNETNDMVIRLSGLSFASGSSDITNEHVPLLEKVEQILAMFPDKKMMVEGHTDDLGDRTTNMRLSEKRAYAVMQYIRERLSIPADRISAMGYGPDKPIGTNTTDEGRAKNRRIDIVIFR